MITWASLALALLTLIGSVLDDRRASRPTRKREEQEDDYDRDIQQQAQAGATGDTVTLTMDFEAERQAAIRRGDLDPAPAVVLQPRA